jgi:hypothetical protein
MPTTTLWPSHRSGSTRPSSSDPKDPGGVEHVELETLDYADWFNHDRPHEALDDLTPAATEETSLRCKERAQADRLSHQTGPPETPGRLTVEFRQVGGAKLHLRQAGCLCAKPYCASANDARHGQL